MYQSPFLNNYLWKNTLLFSLTPVHTVYFILNTLTDLFHEVPGTGLPNAWTCAALPSRELLLLLLVFCFCWSRFSGSVRIHFPVDHPCSFSPFLLLFLDFAWDGWCPRLIPNFIRLLPWSSSLWVGFWSALSNNTCLEFLFVSATTL